MSPREPQPPPGRTAQSPDRARPSAPSELPRDVAEELRRIAHPARVKEALAHTERAVTHLSEANVGGAVREAQRAKALAGRSAAVREILALAQYAAEDYRGALREMQAYRRMSGRLDQNHIIADCYRALGRPDRAVTEAEEALEADLSDEVKAEAAVVGASALADLNRSDQALALLRRVPTRSDVGRPYDLRVWYVTGDILARLGRREEAAREFLKILRHDVSAFDAADRLAQLA